VFSYHQRLKKHFFGFFTSFLGHVMIFFQRRGYSFGTKKKAVQTSKIILKGKMGVPTPQKMPEASL